MTPATVLQGWWPWLAILAALLLGYVLLPVLTPFLLAALLAYLGNPLVERLQRKRLVSRTWQSSLFLLY